jgi:hypothetical protein
MAELVIRSAPEKGALFFMALLEVLEFDDRLALFIAGIDAALLFGC